MPFDVWPLVERSLQEEGIKLLLGFFGDGDVEVILSLEAALRDAASLKSYAQGLFGVHWIRLVILGLVVIKFCRLAIWWWSSDIFEGIKLFGLFGDGEVEVIWFLEAALRDPSLKSYAQGLFGVHWILLVILDLVVMKFCRFTIYDAGFLKS